VRGLVAIVVVVASLACTAQASTLLPVEAQVCFTPQQDCEQLIVGEIGKARHTVRVQAYYLTSTSILRALREAVIRGVIVEAVLDRVNAVKKNGAARYLVLAGAKVWIDRSVTIAHNKLILIDDLEVIGGSFNYTRSAQERNAENVTILSSQTLVSEFSRNWESRRAASDAYDP
jgi:phosphatidylserine/phosphatidylglycerophosphate/cardiolipin synthase-like enzyme